MSDHPTPPRSTYPSWRSLFLLGMTTSVTGNAQAFGFSITITVTYGVVNSVQRDPSVVELLLFALTGVTAFSLSNLLIAWRTDRVGTDSEPTRVVLLSTATDFLAVGVAVGIAVGIAHLSTGWLTWVLAPLFAGLGYILVQSVELAAGWRRTVEREAHDNG